MTDKAPDASPVPAAPPIANLEFKAALLLILMLALMSAAALYLMYARGTFEATQKLVLLADDGEGVVVGMDITFAGFPIGRVSQIALSGTGKVEMTVDVVKKDAHWLRSSSIFTMERGIVGATRLRAFTGILSDPLLPDGAVRNVLAGDVNTEIPRLLSTAKELIQNLSSLTATDSALALSLRNVQSVTEKLAGKSGALGVLAGTDENAQKLYATLDRANQLLASIDGLAVKADSQVFGKNGVMPETRAAVVQLNGVLGDVRISLKKVDAVLIDAQAVGANLKDATVDLAPLRAEVESNLRKVEQLVNTINRKWPFKHETEIKLP